MSRVAFLIATVSVLLLFGDALGASNEPPSYIPVTITEDNDAGQATTRTVVRGESFWTISEEITHAPSAVAPYWRTLIDSNVDRIKSGDPDLIFPGEILLLPSSP